MHVSIIAMCHCNTTNPGRAWCWRSPYPIGHKTAERGVTNKHFPHVGARNEVDLGNCNFFTSCVPTCMPLQKHMLSSPECMEKKEKTSDDHIASHQRAYIHSTHSELFPYRDTRASVRTMSRSMLHIASLVSLDRNNDQATTPSNRGFRTSKPLAAPSLDRMTAPALAVLR